MSKMAPAEWRMTQDQDPGTCYVSSLPKATVPSLSSCVSGPLRLPHFARAQATTIILMWCSLWKLCSSISCLLSFITFGPFLYP